MPLRADYCPQGACRLSLNGTWDFRYFTRAEDVPEDIAAQRWQSAATIPVPSVWQSHGYDAYFYSDERYPFPYDPPYMPRENPCGVYQREFSWPQGEAKCYLNFDGVDSCFFVWANGHLAGYSQVSHSNSEFDITALVTPGVNVLTVAVLKWCDGTYLEDQDKIRASGIFPGRLPGAPSPGACVGCAAARGRLRRNPPPVGLGGYAAGSGAGAG